MRISAARTALFITFFTFLVFGPIRAQQKDLQSWWEFSVDKDLKSGIELSGEIEQRFRNNSLQYDRSLVTLTGEVDIKKYLNVEAGIRALVASNNELRLKARYRIHMDAMGRYTLSRFDLSLRARMQFGFEDFSNSDGRGDHNLVNRYRFKVDRHIFGTRIGWFASMESMHLLSDGPNRFLHKMRYSAGAEYALNFRSQFKLRYVLEEEYNVVNPLQSHILLFSFSHKL